jgi:hypothetical protein
MGISHKRINVRKIKNTDLAIQIQFVIELNWEIAFNEHYKKCALGSLAPRDSVRIELVCLWRWRKWWIEWTECPSGWSSAAFSSAAASSADPQLQCVP